MKFALGIFIVFFVCCVFFIVLAPDSVHEVIDRIHGNSSSNSGSSVVPQDDSGAGVIPSDEKPEPVELGQGAMLPPLADELKPVRGVGASLPTPANEIEMLNWLKVHNYTVAEEQGSYRISWQNLKPVSPKPTAIVVNGDGTVVPQYGNHSVASEGGIVSVGDNNTSGISHN